MTVWRIVCDAGGTNVRFARASAGQIDGVRAVPTSDGLDVAALLASFSETFEDREDLEGAVIAAAGPVQDAQVTLTNADVTIRAAGVRDALQRPVLIMNDLEAVAWAVPHLTVSELRTLLACDMPLAGGKIAINIGTGFGAALLLETARGAHVCALEPGHMKLAAFGASAPAALTATLSIEQVLSGKALADPQMLHALWGLPQAAAIESRHLFATAPASADQQRFISGFSALFGQVCGDLVLATGAWAGVYLTGSVAGAWSQAADMDAFHAAFCDKGPMSARMARVPVHLILAEHPALKGLAAAPLF